ncbi:Mfa1 family fimbria major subunit [Bacteroides helcogenes]|uniref:Minor fimbrium subunit Mfa1 C-terminal domain-containing protein n=1 Tax=Bacteroides helcogenes (strain ATCC 35417 / DSM 20613 / JCM 6297 / CCUG 15421 / P 36-108) TaxID=693979 RepID=E6SPQ3_BACT6|nr:Mfa1 family fimbria major subunit [Bacteroides helcogenes]ADV43894.1 hypothetical protein Bache_1916 [Bacteroides helcogenes P 36-108]MDY5237522.1 Mfa1 family fimbria major subunit [Bacteroides helcogenes]
MKLRSLFLASLAAMTMVSCSNENDPINNGGEGEKNATLLFSIGVPATRATAGGTEEGTASEQTFNTAEVKVKYSNGTTAQFSFTTNDFDKNSSVYTLKNAKKMVVGADANATVYVTINGGEEVSETATKTADYDANASITTGIAAANNFLMSGSATCAITAGITNNVKVTVNRVAAKISEESTATSTSEFTFKTDYRVDGVTVSTEEETMTATIKGYALYNLNKATNVFASTTFATADFFKSITFNKDNKVEYANFVNRTIGDGSTGAYTYCTENNSVANPTAIIYKVTYTYGNGNATNSFFTQKKEDGKTVLYKDFETLNKDNSQAFSAQGLTATSTYDEFIKVGVVKYEAGVAYYLKNIETAGQTNAMIVRNNVYKLNVSKIGGLGKAVIDETTPGDPTYLTLNVTVAQWTINLNSFEL